MTELQFGSSAVWGNHNTLYASLFPGALWHEVMTPARALVMDQTVVFTGTLTSSLMQGNHFGQGKAIDRREYFFILPASAPKHGSNVFATLMSGTLWVRCAKCWM